MAAAVVPRGLRTYVIGVREEPPPPVFVDSSGRRKRRLRRFAYAVCAAALLFVAALWLSQAGVDVRPSPQPACTTPGTDTTGGGLVTPPPRSPAPTQCRPAPAPPGTAGTAT